MEGRIAHGQHFVDDQDFRFEVGRDGEREADVLPGTVALDGRVEVPADLGEFDDAVVLRQDFPAPHPEDTTGQEDVLPSGEFGVEAGADFEQTAEPAAKFYCAGGRHGDTTEHFQQCRFAGAVAAEQTDDFPGIDVERHIFDGPVDVVGGRPAGAQEVLHLAQRVAGHHPRALGDVGQRQPRPTESEALGDILNADRRGHIGFDSAEGQRIEKDSTTIFHSSSVGNAFFWLMRIV